MKETRSQRYLDEVADVARIRLNLFREDELNKEQTSFNPKYALREAVNNFRTFNEWMSQDVQEYFQRTGSGITLFRNWISIVSWGFLSSTSSFKLDGEGIKRVKDNYLWKLEEKELDRLWDYDRVAVSGLAQVNRIEVIDKLLHKIS